MPAFATTRWTLIAKARGDSVEARAALDELCRAYYQPIYAFVRHSHDAAAASDLTQGFFELLIERDLVGRVDRSRGRFRSFLLVALKRHLSDERDQAATQKRGGHVVILSTDAEGVEERYAAGLSANVTRDDTPERAYERAWAETVLGRAMDRLGKEQSAPGKAERFELLRGLLTAQSTSSYAEVGARLDMTEGAVKVAVHRLRQRYRELLVEEVSDTVSSDDEAESELRALLGALER